MASIERARQNIRVNKNGVTVIPETQLPVGVSYIQWRMPRTDLTDPSMAIKVTLEISFDNRASWVPGGGWTAVGGSIINPKTGLPLEFTIGEVTFLQPKNPDRWVRGSITLTNNTANIFHSVALFEGDF